VGARNWAVLAADLLAGDVDPRPHAVDLLRQALAATRGSTGWAVRARLDAGYFAGRVARAALAESVEFAIGANRIAPLWRMLAGIDETD
jgi:hypothetical protein